LKSSTHRAGGGRGRGLRLFLLLSVGSVGSVGSVESVGSAAEAAAPDLKKGLVAHYAFDKDASDSSGNGNDGTAKGARPVAEGRLGGAFAFNGTSDCVAVPPAVTKGLTWFTVALWFKTTQSAGSPRTRFWSNPSLIGVSTGGWGSHDFGLMLENGKVAYFHGLQAVGTDMSWFSSAAVADDKWHHVALVCEGPRMLLYLDGKLAKGEAVRNAGGEQDSLGEQAQTAAGMPLGAAGVLIGACSESGSPAYHFRGLIDDVRIWSRALSADEVAELDGALPKSSAQARAVRSAGFSP